MSTQQINFDRHANVLQVKPAGSRLDASMAEAFVQRCAAELDGIREIHVDLQDIRLLDSAGVGALARIFRQLGEGGQLSLLAPRPEVRMVLEITRLDRVFRIVPAATENA